MNAVVSLNIIIFGLRYTSLTNYHRTD